MGFIKLIIIALLVFVGFYLFKKLRASSTTAEQLSADKMVACSTCKTHIPENEAIMQNGKIYCSKECL
ncbi:hypothetical protein MNB_SUP05-SYMBIONT-5-851 [hydrothermal vent metagenome]|uniref:Prokaryotic metallothionein n=1 Tax=hydrothermal vent metagenome TaxID=652676 RepID=A0A1W1E4C1_9ZZZZ